LISDPPKGFPGSEINWRIRDAFSAFGKELATGADTAVRSVRLGVMQDYLATHLSAETLPIPYQFEELFTRNVRNSVQGPLYTKSEAVALIPPLRNFQSVLRARATRPGAPEHNILRIVDGLLGDLEALVAPPGVSQPPTNAVAQGQGPAVRPAAEAPPTVARLVTNQIPFLPMASTNVLRVARFWQWPLDLAESYEIIPAATAACFRNGRVWIEVLYKSERIYLRKAVVIGLDPGSFSTEVVELPITTNKFNISATESRDELQTGASFEVLGDHLFFSLGDTIKRYSFRSKTWEDLAVPTAGHLTVLDGRLFATTDDSIVELSPNGNTQTILASARRRPAATILDSLENYGQPSIFRGPNGAIATRIHDRLYALDDKTRAWSEITSLPQEPTSAPARSAGESRVCSFSTASWRTNQLFTPVDEFSVAMSAPQPPSLFRRSYSLRDSRSESPLWPEPESLRFAAPRIFLAESNAWVFFGQRWVKTGPVGPPVRANWKTSIESTSPRALYIYWNDLGRPLPIPMEMDLGSVTVSPYLAMEIPFGTHGALGLQTIATPAGLIQINGSFGLWLIPWSDLRTLMKAAREERVAWQQARSSAINALWTKLFQQYQLARKDGFDPERKEAMIDDPAFLELDLNNIDTNRNGILDVGELAFFDVNHNGKLEPRELAGIEITQGLLAQTLFNEYDLNRDGQLDRAEFGNLVADTSDRASNHRGPTGFSQLAQSDLNHDGMINVVELTSFLKQETLANLRPGFRFPPHLAGTVLKGLVESYWGTGEGPAYGRPPMGGPGARPPTVQPMRPSNPAPTSATPPGGK
jgi:Ca2+-binding EF-hand superfamily protein